jgi:hypothetical protein
MTVFLGFMPMKALVSFGRRGSELSIRRGTPGVDGAAAALPLLGEADAFDML